MNSAEKAILSWGSVGCPYFHKPVTVTVRDTGLERGACYFYSRGLTREAMHLVRISALEDPYYDESQAYAGLV